jgi:hypothetical protein
LRGPLHAHTFSREQVLAFNFGSIVFIHLLQEQRKKWRILELLVWKRKSSKDKSSILIPNFVTISDGIAPSKDGQLDVVLVRGHTHVAWWESSRSSVLIASFLFLLYIVDRQLTIGLCNLSTKRLVSFLSGRKRRCIGRRVLD